MSASLSLIIPVYNRPQEVEELLESLSRQTDGDFEIILVEDGSEIKSEAIARQWQSKLNLSYYFKTNSGPGLSRNYGAQKAKADYLIFLDSDCIIPPNYIRAVKSALAKDNLDAFGGPDAADDSFTLIQKAINYAMTSLFTTGGIRGSRKSVEKFHPRSFNMGYSRDVFEKTGGFANLRFGEDIDMSIRMMKAGFKTGLIPEAFVYHKRRTNFRQFFKQVYNSGIARINLYKRHPQSLKILHFFPAIFSLGLAVSLIAAIFSFPYFLALYTVYFLAIFIDSSVKNKSLMVGALSILASAIQLISYGSGFIYAFVKRIVLGQGEFARFTKNFYK